MSLKINMAKTGAAEVLNIKRQQGVAGNYAFTAQVQYEGEEPMLVSFYGSTFGPPIVMEMDNNPKSQVFVSDPGRFGEKLDETWVRNFFSTASKTADLSATGCPASGDGLHKWLRYTSDVLPVTATCAFCGETAETGTKGGWGGWIGSKQALAWNRYEHGGSSIFRVDLGQDGAEVYESPAGAGQWFWHSWLGSSVAASDGGPLALSQAKREAESWLAGAGARVATGSKTAVSPTEDWQKGYDDAINSEWVQNPNELSSHATGWDESMNGNEDYIDGFNAGSDAQDAAKRGQPRGEITTGEGFVAFEDPDDFLDAWLGSKLTASLWEMM